MPRCSSHLTPQAACRPGDNLRLPAACHLLAPVLTFCTLLAPYWPPTGPLQTCICTCRLPACFKQLPMKAADALAPPMRPTDPARPCLDQVGWMALAGSTWRLPFCAAGLLRLA